MSKNVNAGRSRPGKGAQSVATKIVVTQVRRLRTGRRCAGPNWTFVAMLDNVE